MSCVLRVADEDLALEDLLTLLPNPCSQWRKGDPRRTGQVHDRSGANYDVSDAGFDEFEEQKADALAFLTKHRTSIVKAMQLPGIHGMTMDFGIEDRGSFTQSDSFEPELLKIAGELGITMQLSRYPIAEDGDNS